MRSNAKVLLYARKSPAMIVSWRFGAFLSASVVALSVYTSQASAGDWLRFRGPNGAGISQDDHAVATNWSDSENLKWQIELPGPGLSSPILVGDRLFLTCWSGYGVDRGNPGDETKLKRHLVCIDRATGDTLWSRSVDPVLPEEPFRGMFAENGYASHTPVSDGERVYVFFGKPGVLAFDMEGNQLWQVSVGTESDPNGWGSASSPILYKNLVIITASAESEAVIALDKESGREVWRQEAAGFSGTWGTPVLVTRDDGHRDLALAVPYEIWGLNPDTGKLRWYCEGIDSNSMCSSLIADQGVVYAVGGRSGGSIAVRAGGKGDVTKTHVLWKGQQRNRIGTPVLHEGRIHWISGGIANCIDSKTGEQIYQTRLKRDGAQRAESNAAADDGSRRGDRRGRRGGGRGSNDYSSPVVADGKLFYVSRSGDAVVLKLGPEFEQLARNQLGSGSASFSATPAISNGEIFIRSSTSLYCIAEK